MSNAARLSDELWSSIFRHVLGDSRIDSHKPLISIRRVCKSWNVLTRPLIFRDLYLRKESCLGPIAEGLDSAPLSNGTPIGDFIRHVDIQIIGQDQDGQESDALLPLSVHAHNYIVRIFLLATKLNSLTISNMFGPTLLAILSLHSASRSLEFLEVELDQDATVMSNNSLAPVPKHLDRFVKLTRLIMRCHANWPNNETPGLSLPHLDVLCFLSHVPNRDIRSAWLTKCQFGKLSVLAILFPNRKSFGAQASQHMIQFLSAYPDLSPSVTVLDFSGHSITEAEVAYIPPSVPKIAIFCTEEAEDVAWQALEEFAKVELRIQRIHVGMRSTTSKLLLPFTWTAGLASIHDPVQVGSPLSVFTTRILLVAVKLLCKRIELVDAEGRAPSLAFVQRQTDILTLCGVDLFE